MESGKEIAGCPPSMHTVFLHCSLGGNDSIPSIRQSIQFYFFCQTDWPGWAHNPGNLDQQAPCILLTTARGSVAWVGAT